MNNWTFEEFKTKVSNLLSNFDIDANKVKNWDNFVISFTHSTFANENQLKQSYEYHEFLGDAVLQLKVTEYIFNHFQSLTEGKATTLRAATVKTNFIAEISHELKLFDLLRVSKGATGLKDSKKANADLFESLIAAIYLEIGFDGVEKVLQKTIYPALDKLVKKENKDPKSLFQEYMQSAEKTIHYETLTNENGFISKVFCNKTVYGTGEGKSKKEAEENAALHALESLGV
ncbi:ribonuclease III [Mycoplasma sp. 3341]|uniref:ribonuclease III n=1 Tax=Mycoplasma sp. 3341 TaxID=3447506 RepID=UPI003F6575CA